MKLSTKITQLLNQQISMEADASQFYLAMASWCDVSGYEGAAKFFYAQSDEERMHMLKIVRYLNDLGIQATIPKVKDPPKNLKSVEAILKNALKNEQDVTKAIHDIASTAEKENDRTTFEFIQWFVREQAEEEKTFEDILQKFEVIGRDKLAIYEIDKHMGGLAAATSGNGGGGNTAGNGGQ